jgi:hypothetical protein
MALASLSDLTDRLEWTLSDEEERVALGALEELSEMARYYGRPSWDEVTAPRLVVNVVLAAAARFVRNPDGYHTSRAGDETLGWSDRGHDSGTAYFNDREVKMIRSLAGASGIVSVPVTAWNTVNPRLGGLVPTDSPYEKKFPMFNSDDSPW